MQANTIIAAVLRKLLVIPSGGTPSTSQYAEGLEALNDIIKLMSANGSFIYQDTREEISLSSGEQEFTLGSTGDYTTAKPVELLNVSLKEGDTEYPLNIVDKNVYQNFTDTTQEGFPRYVYFRNTHPNSTLYFDVTTDRALTLVLTSNKELSTFPDGTTDVSLPDYYESAFKKILTVEFATEMGAANRITPLMYEMAKEAKDAVIGRAVDISVSRTEIPTVGRRYAANQDANQ